MLLKHAHQLAHFDFIIACDDPQQTGQELAARGALPGASSSDGVWLPASGDPGGTGCGLGPRD
jgi:hypothetical protein